MVYYGYMKTYLKNPIVKFAIIVENYPSGTNETSTLKTFEEKDINYEKMQQLFANKNITIHSAVIITINGERIFSFSDNAPQAVWYFCLLPLIEIIQGTDTAEAFHFDQDYRVLLQRFGSEIEIKSEDPKVDPIKFLESELLPSMYKCAIRYIKFWEEMFSQEKNQHHSILQMKKDAEIVKEFLIKSNLLK